MIRTCVGCRQRADKTTLVRVVAGRDAAGWTVELDLDGSRPGRGAHLHPSDRCLRIAIDRRAFVRALRLEGPVATDALATGIRDVADESLTNRGTSAEAGPTETNRSTRS